MTRSSDFAGLRSQAEALDHGQPAAPRLALSASDAAPRSAATIPFLDLLRWLSALAVVIGHLRDLLLIDYPALDHPSLALSLFYAATGFGHQAVVVFFVLSGYLVGGRLLLHPLESRSDVVRYIVDRFSRIYIVLIPALVLSLGVAAFAATHGSEAAIFGGRYWSSSLDFDFRDRLSPVIILCNIANLQSAACAPLGHDGPLWSLAYEWFYYLSFPVILWVAGWPAQRPRPVRITGLAALCVLGLAAFPGAMLSYPVWIAGAASAAFARRYDARPVLVIAAMGSFLVALAASRVNFLPGLASDYAIGICLALALLKPGFFYRSAEHATPWLAGFSYSLYAIHFPLCVLFVGIFELVGGSATLLSPGPVGLLAFTGALASVYAAAWLFSLATERNTKRLRNWLYARALALEARARMP